MVSPAYACLSVRCISEPSRSTHHRQSPGHVHALARPSPCPHHLLLQNMLSVSARPWEGEQSLFVSSILPQELLHTDIVCPLQSAPLRCWHSGLRKRTISPGMTKGLTDGILPTPRQRRDRPACVCGSATRHALPPQKTPCSALTEGRTLFDLDRSLSGRQPDRPAPPCQRAADLRSAHLTASTEATSMGGLLCPDLTAKRRPGQTL